MKRLPAVETARHILADTESVTFSDAQEAALAVGRLRGAVRGLLGALELQPLTERLAVQNSAEVDNLLRIRRREFASLRATLEAADRIDQALLSLLLPGEGEQR
ncbi:hypothetical protein ACG5V6_14910 [Streptomyces chitinivorans]|uniref:Uncharacterized protein n=1 Tax=Streptomyces chitinivorans TaxID=1257027 RepID=A0ABW7HV89_9ACTN|nr:hypothetical protein [Streptomyces chitinivorans]MDH2407194.1 hypothetical protein [Streptomyces chitinivorans]